MNMNYATYNIKIAINFDSLIIINAHFVRHFLWEIFGIIISLIHLVHEISNFAPRKSQIYRR